LIDTGRPERKRKKEREEQSFSHKKFEFGRVLAKGEFSFPPRQAAGVNWMAICPLLFYEALLKRIARRFPTLPKAKSMVPESAKAWLTPKAN